MDDASTNHAADQLSHDEQTELFKRSQAGDEQARWDLILANTRLVPYVAARIGVRKGKYPPDVVDEVQAAGQEILIRAVDSFDLSMENRFSTYAVAVLEREMRAALSRVNALAEVPHHVRTLLNKVERARRELAALNDGVEPAIEEIMLKLNLSDAERANFESARKLREGAVRLGALEGDDEARGYDPAYEDENLESAGEDSDHTLSRLQEVLSEVDPEIARVVSARFGIGVDEPWPIQQAMEALGVSKVEMRQLESETLQFLVDALRETEE